MLLPQATVNDIKKDVFVDEDHPVAYAEMKVINKGACVKKHVARIHETNADVF